MRLECKLRESSSVRKKDFQMTSRQWCGTNTCSQASLSELDRQSLENNGKVDFNCILLLSDKLTSITSVPAPRQHAAAHLTTHDAVFEFVVFKKPVALLIVDDVQFDFHQFVRRLAADGFRVAPAGCNSFGDVESRGLPEAGWANCFCESEDT